jgi:hypothetical protein
MGGSGVGKRKGKLEGIREKSEELTKNVSQRMKCVRREYRQCLFRLLSEEKRDIVKNMNFIRLQTMLSCYCNFFNTRMGLPVFT